MFTKDFLRFYSKLSWEQTYREIAAKKENWDDFDIALMDGLSGEEFDSRKI